MIHHNTEEGGHFSIGLSAVGEHILVQVQNKYGDQAREALCPYEAEHLALLIMDSLQKLKQRNKQ